MTDTAAPCRFRIRIGRKLRTSRRGNFATGKNKAVGKNGLIFFCAHCGGEPGIAHDAEVTRPRLAYTDNFAVLVDVEIGVVARAAAAGERRVIRIWRAKGRRAPYRSVGIECALALCFNVAHAQACDDLSLSAVRRFCERWHTDSDRRDERDRSKNCDA